MKKLIILCFVMLSASSLTIFAQTAVNITVDTNQDRAAISPYVYGTNTDLTGTENYTARRLGGNRMTGYNWENNASNAGSDWQQSSDNYMTSTMGIPAASENIPGITATTFHDQSLNMGVPYTLMTLQMAGYVAKDKNGTVLESEVAPSARWDKVLPAKGSAFSLNPSLTDGNVYMDEFVNMLVNKYGNAASSRGIKGYLLDNEPCLWYSTHPRIHPIPVTCQELITKSVDLAKAVKNVDAAAEIIGPVLYGFAAYTDLQGATDWANVKSNYRWFVEYYLDQMKKASTTAGKRLLDDFDVHWYPEAQGGGIRIIEATDTNIDCNKARIQAPRTLWDPTYIEDSWIGQWFSSYLPILPNLKQAIDTYYPGTKLSVTEYNYGGFNHISGGIAMTDALGIFGKYGVYMANFWPGSGSMNYVTSAFKIYRNYDGNKSTYGDTKVKADTTDVANSSVYASIKGTDDSVLHMILINKNYDNAEQATVKITGSKNYTSADVYAFDGSSSNITQKAQITNITNNSFSYTLPALSVYHLVLKSSGTAVTLGDVNGDKVININDALLVAQYSAGLTLTNFIKEAADVNKDGAVNIVDAMLIAQYTVGLIKF